MPEPAGVGSNDITPEELKIALLRTPRTARYRRKIADPAAQLRAEQQERSRRLESELLRLAGCHSDDEDGEEEEVEESLPPPKRRMPATAAPKRAAPEKQEKPQSNDDSEDETPPTPEFLKKRKRGRKRVLPAMGALQLSYNPAFHRKVDFEERSARDLGEEDPVEASQTLQTPSERSTASTPARKMFPISVLGQKLREAMKTNASTTGTVVTPKPAGKNWLGSIDSELITASTAVEGETLELASKPRKHVIAGDKRGGIPVTRADDILRSSREVTRDVPKESKISKEQKEDGRRGELPLPKGPQMVSDVSSASGPSPSSMIGRPDRTAGKKQQMIPTLSEKSIHAQKDQPAVVTAGGPKTPYQKSRYAQQHALETEEISDDEFEMNVPKRAVSVYKKLQLTSKPISREIFREIPNTPKSNPRKGLQLYSSSSRTPILALEPKKALAVSQSDCGSLISPHVQSSSDGTPYKLGPAPQCQFPSSRSSVLTLNPKIGPLTLGTARHFDASTPHNNSGLSKMLSVYKPPPRKMTQPHMSLSSILSRNNGASRQKTQPHGLFRTPRKPPPQLPCPSEDVPDAEALRTPEPSDEDVQPENLGKSYFGTAIQTLNARSVTALPRAKTGAFREQNGHREVALNMTKLDLATKPVSRARTKLPFKPPTMTSTPGVVTQVVKKRNMTVTRFAPAAGQKRKSSAKRKKSGDLDGDGDDDDVNKRNGTCVQDPLAGESSFRQVRDAW
ncbi:hypothetical protein FN846DRAFT_906921 [Sphaerosporella brunnea]|uniref:Uncharacterized protein n=1 Tax=Sphaerosporella brunnea TaxID=1250544 RepID=A0A5J5EXT4_9PEZI|nr:hypothetical protein FN846DRAFT_906921 [Sphaerosporella brunnea]